MSRRTDTSGYAQLLGWILDHAPGPRIVVSIEGTRSYGIGLARAATTTGLPVFECEQPHRKPDAARQNLGQIRPDRRPPRRTVRPRSASTPSTADPARPAHPARRPPRRILPPVVATALMAVGRTQVRDRHLRFHEDRDNLGAGCPARWPAWSARPGVRRSQSPTPPAAPATQPARRPPTTPAPLVSPASRRAQTTAPTRARRVRVQRVHPHLQRVSRDPQSAAIPRSVAPGVDRYRSTAWRRNSSV